MRDLKSNSLADLILAATNSSDSKVFSSLGDTLYKTAQEIKEKEASEIDDEIELLRAKFKRFRTHEKNKDLLFISYPNFYSLNSDVKFHIKELDHILWGGVYVSHLEFRNNIPVIFGNTANSIVVIEKRGSHYELFHHVSNPRYKNLSVVPRPYDPNYLPSNYSIIIVDNEIHVEEN